IGANLSDDPVDSIVLGLAGALVGKFIGDTVFSYSKKSIKKQLDLLGKDIESYLTNESGLVFKEWDLISYLEIESYIKTEEAMSFLMEQRSVLVKRIKKILGPQVKLIKKQREIVDFEIVEEEYLEKTKSFYEETQEKYQTILKDAKEFESYLIKKFG
ncbi:MAG: hypothetical protein ACRCZ2_09815, partial [Fusobacteriaceae bacterium]